MRLEAGLGTDHLAVAVNLGRKRLRPVGGSAGLEQKFEPAAVVDLKLGLDGMPEVLAIAAAASSLILSASTIVTRGIKTFTGSPSLPFSVRVTSSLRQLTTLRMSSRTTCSTVTSAYTTAEGKEKKSRTCSCLTFSKTST
jgi:hypothetical protein